MRGDELQGAKIIGRRRHRTEERPAGRKLTDSGDAHHVIAKAIECIEYPFASHRKILPLIHAQEKDAQPGRKLAFALQRQERFIHRERVAGGEPVKDKRVLHVASARLDELAHVDVRCHAHAGRIGHRIECALFLILRGLQGGERVHCGK